MPVVITCPHCQKKIGVPETAIGKSIRCPFCQAVSQAIVAPPAATLPPAIAPPARPPILPPAPPPAAKPATLSPKKPPVAPPSAKRQPPQVVSPEPDEPFAFSANPPAPRQRDRAQPAANKPVRDKSVRAQPAGEGPAGAPPATAALMKKKWVLFVALGVGAIAFGVAFFLVRAAVMALFGGGPIVDSDWRKFTPPGERFQVLMPGEPRLEVQAGPGANPINAYTVERHRGKVSFVVTVAHLTHQEITNVPWGARFQGGMRGMVASAPKAQLKRERPVTVDGNPGLECVIDVPGKGILVARLVGVREASRGSLVILIAAGPDYSEGTPEVKKFFGSFEVLPEPVPELSAALQTANSGQKIAILNQLKKHGPKALEALPALEKVLENTADPQPSMDAAELLGDIGPAAAAAVPALTKVLKTQHPRKQGPDNGNIRLRVAGALTQIDPKNDFAVEVLKDCVKDPNAAVRVWARYYLARLDPAVYAADLDELIREFLAHGNEHFSATDAMVKLGPLAKKAVPSLVKTLQGKDNGMKLDVIRVLAAIGPPAQEALPVLRAIDVPGMPEFRQAAQEACKKIEGQP